MNVVIIEDSSKTWYGGGQKVTIEVARVLKDRYRLTLFDCTSNSLFFKKSNELFSDIFILKCCGGIHGGSRSSFSIGLREVFVSPFLFLLNLFNTALFFKRKALNRNNTVLYAATKKSLFLAYLLKLFFGYSYIFHAHSFDDKGSLFYKLIKLPLKQSDKIICVSDTVKNNIDLPQCLTVYNPIVIGSNRPKKLNDKIIVASFSNLLKWKGIEYFMRSHDLLSNKDKVEYWVFGDGEERANLSVYQSPNVILKEFADNVDELMRDNISIVVVPSISSEACPMVPVEALSYGIPVITTDIGGQAEIVKDGHVGFQVPVKDPQAIASKIDFLIDNEDIYEEMSKNTLEYSKEFNIENFREQIEDIFLEKTGP